MLISRARSSTASNQLNQLKPTTEERNFVPFDLQAEAGGLKEERARKKNGNDQLIAQVEGARAACTRAEAGVWLALERLISWPLGARAPWRAR